jgi:hypothetical protein
VHLVDKSDTPVSPMVLLSFVLHFILAFQFCTTGLGFAQEIYDLLMVGWKHILVHVATKDSKVRNSILNKLTGFNHIA